MACANSSATEITFIFGLSCFNGIESETITSSNTEFVILEWALWDKTA
jgi:hypothetical protein